jgi:hypothetical protein
MRRDPVDAGAVAGGAEIGAGIRPRSQHRSDPPRGRHASEGGSELRVEIDRPIGDVLAVRSGLAFRLVGLEAQDALRHPLGRVERGEQFRELVASTLVRIDPGLLARNDPPIDCDRGARSVGRSLRP